MKLAAFKFDKTLYGAIQSNIKLNSSYKYKQLTELLGIKYVSGKSKQLQIKMLSNYMDFEYDESVKRYIVSYIKSEDEIDCPKYVCRSDSLYIDDAQALIADYLLSCPDDEIITNFNQLAAIANIRPKDSLEFFGKNIDYHDKDYTEMIQAFPQNNTTDFKILSEQWDNITSKSMGYVVRTLKQLPLCDLQSTMVAYDNNTYTPFDAKNLKLFKQIQDKVLQRYGFESEYSLSSVNFSSIYLRREIRKEFLRQQNKIHKYFQGYVIFINRQECKQFLNDYPNSIEMARKNVADYVGERILKVCSEYYKTHGLTFGDSDMAVSNKFPRLCESIVKKFYSGGCAQHCKEVDSVSELIDSIAS